MPSRKPRMTKKQSEYPPTPELDKMKNIAPISQKLGEFLDLFLPEKGLELCRYQESGDNGKPKYRWKDGVKITKLDGRSVTDRDPAWKDKFNLDAEDNPEYESWNEGYFSSHSSIQKLLAEFFEIDLRKVEDERCAILDHIRKVQNL